MKKCFYLISLFILATSSVDKLADNGCSKFHREEARKGKKSEKLEAEEVKLGVTAVYVGFYNITVDKTNLKFGAHLENQKGNCTGSETKRITRPYRIHHLEQAAAPPLKTNPQSQFVSRSQATLHYKINPSSRGLPDQRVLSPQSPPTPRPTPSPQPTPQSASPLQQQPTASSTFKPKMEKVTEPPESTEVEDTETIDCKPNIKCYEDRDCGHGQCIGGRKCECLGCPALLSCKKDNDCGGFIDACDVAKGFCDCERGARAAGFKTYFGSLSTLCQIECISNDDCYGLRCLPGFCNCNK